MHVLLTGATGFVGKAVAANLISRGHQVHALVRPPRSSQPPASSEFARGVTPFPGSLQDAQSIRRAAVGCEAAIHLVGIIEERPADGVTFRSVHVEGTRAVLEALTDVGVPRLVHMSALGTRQHAVSEYHRTKYEAEQLVRQSALKWTIFRPGLIHGREGDFTRMMADWALGRAAPWLFMPYFGRGLLGLGEKARIAPVFVDDVARAFVESLTPPTADRTISQTYDLVGPDDLTWPGLHSAFSVALRGKRWRKPAIAIPAWYAELLARVLPASLLPFNLAQVQMAREDNTTSDAARAAFNTTFGWEPRTYRRTLDTYIRSLA